MGTHPLLAAGNRPRRRARRAARQRQPANDHAAGTAFDLPRPQGPQAGLRQSHREDPSRRSGHTRPAAELAAHTLLGTLRVEVIAELRATGLTRGESRPEGSERLQVSCLPWPEAWRMLRAGEIIKRLRALVRNRQTQEELLDRIGETKPQGSGWLPQSISAVITSMEKNTRCPSGRRRKRWESRRL